MQNVCVVGVLRDHFSVVSAPSLRNANMLLEELYDIDKLFGVWKRKEDFLLLNHLLILAKHHIYECRKKQHPSFSSSLH